jgi:ribosomal protein S18 acetylase RimI-like enzyme
MKRLNFACPASLFTWGYDLRPETPDDEPAMRVLYIAHRTGEFAQLSLPESAKLALLGQQFEIQRAAYRASHPDALFLALTQRGEIVGRLYLANEGPDVALLDILLGASTRANGIGSALIGELMAVAFAGGVGVLLHVEKHNRACRLYERLGFRVARDAGTHWLMEARTGRGALDAPRTAA